MKNLDFTEIFTALGLDDLSTEEKEKRFLEMQDVVERRVFIRLTDMLPKKDLAIFDKLEGDDEMDRFLFDRSIDLGRLAEEVAIEYREELIKEMTFLETKLDR